MPTDDDASQVFGLAEILRILRRRWRWIAGSVVVCTGLVLTLSLQTTAKYQATAKVGEALAAEAELICALREL